MWGCNTDGSGRAESGVTDDPGRSASGGSVSGLPDRFILVLGTAQDAGYPQAGCNRECCRGLYTEAGPPDTGRAGTGPSGKEAPKANARRVSSLAIIDRPRGRFWLIDATPDFREQLRAAQSMLPIPAAPGEAGADLTLPAGIFLTHAHTGHYTGLMHLGREAIGARGVKVYAMPRMAGFLKANGPWSQLVSLGNVVIDEIRPDVSITLTDSLSITPFLVPHRDEYSETVGYEIRSGRKRTLYIPDIDKWGKWDRDIVAEVTRADWLLLDGTFYSEGELRGRSMAEVPHPLITETVRLCAGLNPEAKAKIHFIHLNHTNPLLRENTTERAEFVKTGFRLAVQAEIFGF